MYEEVDMVNKRNNFRTQQTSCRIDNKKPIPEYFVINHKEKIKFYNTSDLKQVFFIKSLCFTKTFSVKIKYTQKLYIPDE